MDYIKWRRQYDPFEESPLCDCEQKAAVASLNRWREANLPYGEANTFESFKPRRGAIKALEAAQEFAAGQGSAFLTLVGSVGSGKSHLAEAIARVCLASGLRVRYEHVGDMLLRFQAAIRNPDRDMAQEINLCRWWDVLILDDLGVQVDTPWAVQTLDDIINARYAAKRRTVITTNETEAKMKRTPAVRMADRIFDRNTGRTRVVILQCGSYRTGDLNAGEVL